MRFSDLERAIPKTSSEMLGKQQLGSLAAEDRVRTPTSSGAAEGEYCLTLGPIPLSYA